jgi:uncharacterized NAD(P)/FAD-binding protein YdhS
VEARLGNEITDEDSLPRSILGEYLSWYFRRTVEILPDGVSLSLHQDCATNVDVRGNEVASVSLASGTGFETDFLFVSTGHGINEPDHQERQLDKFVKEHVARNGKLRHVRDPYAAGALADIDARTTVAVQGFGLTAYDVVSELTVGRGGEFVRHAEGLEYRKSGLEPRLLIFSRRCIPFGARAINRKPPGKVHQAHFFNAESVNAARKEALQAGGNGQLDFDRDILPLLLKEMAYAYSTARRGAGLDPSTYAATDEDIAAVKDMLYPLRKTRFEDIDDFRKFVLKCLADDVAECKLGNVASPIKAAIDVIRVSRPCFRAAVDFGGLTPESHERFTNHYVPILNQLALGPPMHRNEELLALFEAGVLDVAGGTNSVTAFDEDLARFAIKSRFDRGVFVNTADVIVAARVATFRPEEAASEFYRNLLIRGVVRSYRNGLYHPGGLDIDRQYRPLMKNGKPVCNMWMVGCPVEGPNFFTNVLPLPGISSQPVLDADCCVFGLFEGLSKRHRSELAACEPQSGKRHLV